MVFIKLGEDKLIELAITTGSTPIAVTTATEIRVNLFITKNSVKTLAAKYSLTIQTGYGVCGVKIGVGNENIVVAKVERVQSKLFPVGVMSAEVIVQFIDATFPSGKRHTVYSFDGLGETISAGSSIEPLP